MLRSHSHRALSSVLWLQRKREEMASSSVGNHEDREWELFCRINGRIQSHQKTSGRKGEQGQSDWLRIPHAFYGGGVAFGICNARGVAEHRIEEDCRSRGKGRERHKPPTL